jgi:hypothetical protein
VDAVAAWILLPLVLLLASWGTGLLVERLLGTELEGGLAVPLGFGATMVVLSVPYGLGLPATVATPVIAVVAVAGLVLSRSRLRASLPDRAAGLATLGVYLLYIAPVALTGSATFAGYTFLGDNAVHFSLVDHAREHGSRMTDIPFSSYGRVLELNLGNGYPLGPHFQLASLTTLLGTDVAWLYQGYVASVAALAAIPAARLLGSLGLRPRARAAGAFVAVAAYLPFSYGLQGGAKELIMAGLVLLGAVLAADLAVATRPLRPAALFAVPMAASFTVYSAGGLAWFGVMAAVALGLAVLRSPQRGRTLAVAAGALAAVFALGAAASLGSAIDFFEPARRLLGSSTEAGKGNLVNALSPFETLGVWLSGDYRFGTGTPAIAYPVIALAALLAAVGGVAAARRRALGPLLAAGTAVLVWLVLPAGIYIEAKLLAIASPPLVLLAIGGAGAVTRDHRLRVAGVLAAAALAAAVVVSDGMAIRDAYIAPKDRLDELREVGERFAGTGPAMLDEFEEYGKYFLRESNAIAPFDGYAQVAAQLRVPDLTYDTWADLDELTLDYVEEFALIVRRRNPVASRPPSNYRRVFLGDYYEVWRTREGAPRPLDHLSLGDGNDPTGEVDCAAVRQLAARPDGGELVAAERPPPLQLRAADMTLPAGWPVLPDGTVGALSAGELRGELTAPAGRYRVWVRGTFGRGADVIVDGRTVGRADQIQTREQMALAGEAELQDGPQEIRLVRGGPALLPGNGRDESYDAVFLEPTAPVVLRRVPPERASSLCGTRADWVELLAR